MVQIMKGFQLRSTRHLPITIFDQPDPLEFLRIMKESIGLLDYFSVFTPPGNPSIGEKRRAFAFTTSALMSTLPCASIEAGASIEAPFHPPTNYRKIEQFQK
jgi:hypothetical protein